MTGHHTIHVSVRDIGAWFTDPEEFAALLDEIAYRLEEQGEDMTAWANALPEYIETACGQELHTQIVTPPQAKE